MDLNNDQIQKLKSIGLNNLENKKNQKTNFVPLISISGITLLSFGGLMLLKSNNTASIPNPVNNQLPINNQIVPTQVPKSIQHYLLTSQQNFTQALSINNEEEKIELINQSILAATNAIKDFPEDHRGFYQRARIYQSLSDNKTEFLDQSILDYNQANNLNPNSAEITRDLASAYAKKGDVINTLTYLTETINLEPTKAQNFYDLAKIQEQSGYINDAITTYDQLLTLVSDNTQKNQIETEKQTLKKIIKENPSLANQNNLPLPTLNQTETPSFDSPKIQASDLTASKSLIVASPEEETKIEIKNQTDSNSLSGNNILASGQKEISILNSKIISTSQIYVTATKGGKNQNLQVLSRTDDSFTVGLDSSINEPIEFKWWIIN